MKSYNNQTLKKMGEQEGEKMHHVMSNEQLAIPFEMVQPGVPPRFRHTLKELREMEQNSRGRLLHFIHLYSYEKITRPSEKGDAAKIKLIADFMKEVKRSKNVKHTLSKKDFQVNQEGLFSQEQMDAMVVHKKQETESQKPL